MLDDLSTTCDNIQVIQETKKQNKNKWIQSFFALMPIIIIIVLFIFFQFNNSAKIDIIHYFQDLKNITPIKALKIVLLGIFIMCAGAPYIIFEMALGYIFKYQIALAFAVIPKVISELLCFYVAKHLMRNILYDLFKDSETFQLIYRISQKYPWKCANLLRSNAVLPSFLINFSSGLLEINWVQFSSTLVLWGLVYSMFTVYFGSQFDNIKQIIAKGQYQHQSNFFYFEIIVAILSIIAIICICLYSNKLMEQMRQEINEENKQLQEISEKQRKISDHLSNYELEKNDLEIQKQQQLKTINE